MNTSTRTLEQERTRLARKLGAAKEALRVETPDWQTLMRQGVLVRLHLRRWRARSKVDFQDLGLPEPDAAEREQFDELMTLGAKWLLPAKYLKLLDAIDSGARKHLKKFAYATYWGSFVPVTAYDEWKAGNEGFERRYLAVRDEIFQEWDAIMRELRAGYRAQAVKAYGQLKKLRPSLLRLRTGRTLTESEFVSRFMTRVSEATPEPEKVRDSFAYEIELSYIPLPSLLEQDLLERERIEGARREEQRRAFLAAKELNVEETAQHHRAELMQRMNEDVVREARTRQKQLVDEFLRDVDAQLIGTMREGLVNVLESIERNNGVLVGKAADQVRGIVKSVEAMNFSGNATIANEIAQVRCVMEGEKRDPALVRSLLKQLVTAQRSRLQDLELGPERGKRTDWIGVEDDDVPALDNARRGRRVSELATVED